MIIGEKKKDVKSPHCNLHSESLHSINRSLRPGGPASSGSSRRQSAVVPIGFPGRHLVLEDHAEELPPQPLGQPRVLDHRHLEALAAECGVVVGVDGSAHALDDHQVSFPLAHHHRQHFVQATAGPRDRKETMSQLQEGVWVSLFLLFVCISGGT